MKNRIKELRQENNLTLRQLGEKLDMKNSTLSQYETGQREPRLETWQKLANYFGVSVLSLMGINETATSKIEPAELNAVTINLYKGEDVYNFIKSLDVDRPIALKILNFIQDYSKGFNQSQKSDQERYERKINMLEGELDDAADQLRQIIAQIEEE